MAKPQITPTDIGSKFKFCSSRYEESFAL